MEEETAIDDLQLNFFFSRLNLENATSQPPSNPTHHLRPFSRNNYPPLINDSTNNISFHGLHATLPPLTPSPTATHDLFAYQYRLPLNTPTNNSVFHADHISGRKRKKKTSQVAVRPFLPVTKLAKHAADVQHADKVRTAILSASTKEEVVWFFNNLRENLVDLMVHPVGWMAVKSLVAAADSNMKRQMVNDLAFLRHDFINACKHVHGSQVLKGFVSDLDTLEQQFLIASTIAPDAVELVMHEKGHIVLNACLNNFRRHLLQNIYSMLASECLKISTDPTGCYGIQIIIKNSHGMALEELANPIVENAVYLSNHSSGNFVVQCLLEVEIPRIVTRVVRKLRRHFQMLSLEQCGSNVVQKLLKLCSIQDRELIIRELIHDKYEFESMLDDRYANYVIQDAWISSKGQLIHEVLDNILRPLLPELRGLQFGKYVASVLTSGRTHKRS